MSGYMYSTRDREWSAYFLTEYRAIAAARAKLRRNPGWVAIIYFEDGTYQEIVATVEASYDQPARTHIRRNQVRKVWDQVENRGEND